MSFDHGLLAKTFVVFPSLLIVTVEVLLLKIRWSRLKAGTKREIPVK